MQTPARAVSKNDKVLERVDSQGRNRRWGLRVMGSWFSLFKRIVGRKTNEKRSALVTRVFLERFGGTREIESQIYKNRKFFI